MAKRSTPSGSPKHLPPGGAPEASATARAGAGWQTDKTALDLATWADSSPKPPNDISRSLESPFAPGLQRFNAVMRGRSDPDDTANDASLMSPAQRAIATVGEVRDYYRRDPDDETGAGARSFALDNLQRRQLRGQAQDDFNAANHHYDQSHMTGHAPAQPDQQLSGPTGKPRGFQIHKVQAAAQRARGANYQGPDDEGAD